MLRRLWLAWFGVALLIGCQQPAPQPPAPPIPAPAPTPTPPTPPAPVPSGAVSWPAWQSISVGDTVAQVVTKAGPGHGEFIDGRNVLTFTVAHPTRGAVTGILVIEGGKVAHVDAW